ncbi:MAG: excinuclease ABC subunit UvrC [Synergistaceae bacterium]|nr:excinuclease ABC subunit UvrC [Synergistaceae bacterium]
MRRQSNMKEKISAILKSLPERPGVYLMRDINGKIIYVGKAIKLKRRVSSYFRHSHSSPRLRKLVELIEDISIIRTETEAEALIVEAKLIRRYSPFFNIELKMSDKYPFVKITNEDFPRIEITRHKSNDGAVYLGPFVDAGNIRNLMRLAERYFPLRVCRSKINPAVKKRPCVEYSLGRSMGACAGLCSQSEYRERVADLILLFEGKQPELVERLRQRMDMAAKKLEFEKAARYRDTIRAVWKLSRQKISSALQEDLDNETWKVLNRVQELLGLKVLAWRIDAFDISHTHGHDTYGCCVVFEQGRPSPNLYRRFKIRSIADGEINDFESMYETVKRRYAHVMDNSEPAPQLAVIDGGTGQLEYAQRAIKDLGYDIPMIALAEREELIFTSGNPEPLRLGRDDPALQLFQRLRDEVHRYAITTHRNARDKHLRHSRLDDIEGIGRKKAAELLVKFGSAKKISELSVEELREVKGIGEKLAVKILEGLKG